MFKITILNNYRYTSFVLWSKTINSKIKEWCKDFPVFWLIYVSFLAQKSTYKHFHNQKNQKNQTFSQSKNQKKMVNEWGVVLEDLNQFRKWRRVRSPNSN